MLMAAALSFSSCLERTYAGQHQQLGVGSGKGAGLARAVPRGLVRRVGDGCEQGHLRGRQSACHFCSGTCRHQGDRRQRGQDSGADSLSVAAAIKPTTSHARSPTRHAEVAGISIAPHL